MRSGPARLAGRLREEFRHVEQWRHERDAVYLLEVCGLAAVHLADESPVEVDARRTTARYVERNFSGVEDEIEQTADRRLIKEVGELLALADLPQLVPRMLDFLAARATAEERDEIAKLLATPYLRHLLPEWHSRLT